MHECDKTSQNSGLQVPVLCVEPGSVGCQSHLNDKIGNIFSSALLFSLLVLIFSLIVSLSTLFTGEMRFYSLKHLQKTLVFADREM